MGLSAKQNHKSLGRQPYYIKEGTVKSVTTKPDSEYDLHLQIEFAYEKTEFTKKFTICGNFERDGMSNILGWGKAWKVETTISTLLGHSDWDTSEDGKVDHLFPELIGKKAFTLEYIAEWNNKATYFIYDISKDPAGLESYFLQQVSKGKIKKYNPDLVYIKSNPTPAAAQEIDEEPPF